MKRIQQVNNVLSLIIIIFILKLVHCIYVHVLYYCQKTLDKMPFECLKMIVEILAFEDRISTAKNSKGLRQAVANSRWSNMGDSKFVISADLEKTAYSVSFGGVLTQEFDAGTSGEAISFVHSLFARLHLKELRLHYKISVEWSFHVRPEHDTLRPFYEFINDGCTFDRLVVRINRLAMVTERIHELVMKAEKKVVIDLAGVHLTRDEFLSFARPVQFVWLRCWNQWIVPSDALNDELVTELVSRGHSFSKFTMQLSSVEAIIDIIEGVSTSKIHQKIDFRVVEHKLCEEYVERVHATPGSDYDFEPNDDWFSNLEGTEIQTYSHLGALIHLAKVDETLEDARISVTSENYDEKKD